MTGFKGTIMINSLIEELSDEIARVRMMIVFGEIDKEHCEKASERLTAAELAIKWDKINDMIELLQLLKQYKTI